MAYSPEPYTREQADAWAAAAKARQAANPPKDPGPLDLYAGTPADRLAMIHGEASPDFIDRPARRPQDDTTVRWSILAAAFRASRNAHETTELAAQYIHAPGRLIITGVGGERDKWVSSYRGLTAIANARAAQGRPTVLEVASGSSEAIRRALNNQGHPGAWNEFYDALSGCEVRPLG